MAIKKLRLAELKVKSLVTETGHLNRIKGGYTHRCGDCGGGGNDDGGGSDPADYTWPGC